MNLGTTLHINTKLTTTKLTTTGIPTPAFNGDITPGGGDIHTGTINIHANKISYLLNAIISIQHDIAGGGGKICGDEYIATQQGQIPRSPADGGGNRYCTR